MVSLWSLWSLMSQNGFPRDTRAKKGEKNLISLRNLDARLINESKWKDKHAHKKAIDQ